MKPYSPEIEQEMKKFYQSLPEKDKRRYAAIEARKLGHGGIVYIASVPGCHRSTVSSGLDELELLDAEPTYETRIE